MSQWKAVSFSLKHEGPICVSGVCVRECETVFLIAICLSCEMWRFLLWFDMNETFDMSYLKDSLKGLMNFGWEMNVRASASCL